MNMLHGLTKTNQSPAERMQWISNSAKVLVKKVSPSALLALLGVGAIYLISSNGFPRRTAAPPNASADVPTAGVKKDPPGVAPVGGDGTVVSSGPVSQDTNEADHAAIAENSPAIDQAPAPAPSPAPVQSPAPTPAVGSKTIASDNEFLEKQPPDIERKNIEKQPKEVDRKSLERKREQAERKRARLEGMYQKHLISSEAYKKGEEKYKSEIEKYRSAVSAGKPKNDS
jgi:hypothetical protein